MKRAYPDFTGESFKLIWPGTFKKDQAEREGFTVEFFFCGDSERCRYNMDNVHIGLGFYQFDTSQDAIYFGTWVNPSGLQVLQYAEGDISLVTCKSVQDYENQLAKMDGRLDDHDDQHWVRLGGQYETSVADAEQVADKNY